MSTLTLGVVYVAHGGRLKSNETLQIGKVCAIKVDVESSEYREDRRNQSDSSEGTKHNTGRLDCSTQRPMLCETAPEAVE